MKGYYTSGEFAKKANVSTRTIRYYDNENILKPSMVSENGYRMYTDSDFAKLQKILSLRYLGFSLEEIRAMTVNDEDADYIGKSMQLQLRLVRKRIDDLKLLEETLLETSKYVEHKEQVDWTNILHLIHISNMERTLVEQYKDSANTDIRISLHQKYSMNQQGWYPWIYSNLGVKEGQKILEIGCGNARLWTENRDKIPENIDIYLSDISKGMLSDAQENLKTVQEDGGNKEKKNCFTFLECDCQSIPLMDASIDLVTANHVLFYVKDLNQGLEEIRRVLKPGGFFYCSTYGKEHMKEISQLVRKFDNRINLSEINLYDIFGLENGKAQLEKHFDSVERVDYKDCLKIDDVKPLMEYILSCHGNQQEYLNGRYEEFREFLQRELSKKGILKISKSAGMFRCY